MVKEQLVHAPYEWQLKRLKFTRDELACFEERICRDKQGGQQYRRYFFTEPWRFVLRVKPNMITHTRLRDEAAEKRIDEIDQLLTQRGWSNVLCKLKGGSGGRWYGGRDYKKGLPVTSPLLRFLDEVKDEQPDGYYSQSMVSNE